MSIWEEAQALNDEIVARRRDLHKYPETGWTEFRTASVIISELEKIGYAVSYGAAVVDGDSMMGVPDEQVLENAMKRACEEGADPLHVEQMRGGKTGVVGVLDTGKPGKTLAFRFDIDCNDVNEDQTQAHRPSAEGFSSVHASEMHACGHDGHVSAGLALAKLLMQHKDDLAGRVKLIFQPAEEGARGAYSMLNAGVVDDVDYFLGGHIGFKVLRNNTVAVLTGGMLATTKLDAFYKGVAAHAAAAPEQGKSALLAAAQAAISLTGISRHSQGPSRINVGVLQAGTGRNVIPDQASLKIETRGYTTEINEHVRGETYRMLQACADLYDVKLETRMAGGAPSCVADVEFSQEVSELIKSTCGYDEIIDYVDMSASEDSAYFMERVQQRGGKALYLMFGSEIAAGHHNNCFDFEEDVMWKAAAALAETALHFCRK